MELAAVILFLVLYYLRPQEWFSFFGEIRFAQWVMIFALCAIFFRERSVRLGNLLRTPHDWMVLGFWGWMVISSPTKWETFQNSYSLIVTYLIIVQVLTSVKRIKVFVGWWTFLIVAIAALAVASEHGYDPLGSYDLTHGRMKGRLALNLSIFRNPNALGHNVVTAIPMLYYFAIWRRPLFMKEIGFALILLPMWCIWKTVSKGAFLTGIGVVLATLTFGRPKGVQALIIAGAIVFGGGALWALPRMQELKRSKTDEAIQGRVAAFTYGLRVIKTDWNGVGYIQWLKSFGGVYGSRKAAHSSYVQIGAELGYPGFFFFIAIMYCCLRTLITARSKTDDEERIRRILFVLVFSYAVSSWMVDLGYRPTFFMFTGAIAALHRLLLGLTDETPEEAAPDSALPAWRARLIPQPATEAALAAANTQVAAPLLGPSPGVTPVVLSMERPDDDEQQGPQIWQRWNRIGIIDAALILALTMAAVRFWDFMKNRM